MNVEGIAIALGCIILGIALTVGAIQQARRGVTPSGGTGGPIGPIRRDEHPGYFTYVFWVRIILGPIAATAGLVGLLHLS